MAPPLNSNSTYEINYTFGYQKWISRSISLNTKDSNTFLIIYLRFLFFLSRDSTIIAIRNSNK